ncbi:RND transporter [Cupriavidus malaysiensis]|uniref:RND transporter n=2 Tax=Cupriavidus malaysiensis TaxID=367825 RepID=A0ABN4TXU9_9BURK|nr:efflux transporter outer membrane subunit [Cupriavidus malaysiensis]AOZ10580.1 RND transporter [Cupriavidus malaysiensis]
MPRQNRPSPTAARWLYAALALPLAACTMEPAYHRPDAPIPSAWPGGPAYAPASGSAAQAAPQATLGEVGWREFFVDPSMQELISRALSGNRDLRIAALAVDEARALYRVQRAAQFPEIDANAGLTSQRVSPRLRAPGQGAQINSFTAGIGFTAYELDFFGRVRSLKHAALEQYMATEDARRSAQITLVAEVADAYLTLLADRELLALSQDTLKSQQEAAEMVSRGQRAGALAKLDEHRAQTQLQTAQVGVEQYTRQVAQDENALTLLLGGPLPDGLQQLPALDSPDLLAQVPAGLPSSLLERRPDIRAAEHQLKAANANIGAARAAFFPSITLTGALGVASTSLAGLFSGGLAWVFAPQLTLPIFNAGRNQANLDLAKVRKDINVANYEKTIQTAFREVADSMAATGTYDRQIQAQRTMIEEIRETERLSRMRFRNGVDDYFSVFDAQRQLYSAQQQLVAYRLARLDSEVSLYKALGGGWRDADGAAGTAGARPAAAAAAGAAPGTD